jgi:very-short-patch-repair endonuclease
MTPKNLERIWPRARREHYVVTREELLAHGYTADAIRHRLNNGDLFRLWRGVYSVGRPEPDRFGWWMAAVKACGPEAMLSHASAAALYGIRPFSNGLIHVSVPLSARRSRRPIAVHQRAPLARATRNHIPVTTIVDTLIDIALHLPPSDLEQAIAEADIRKLIDPEALRSALDDIAPRPGLGKLRTILDRRTYVMTHSHLERLFLPIAYRAGLPKPETQRYLGSHRVDFFWPDLELVVEVDGLTYHRTAAKQADDCVRNLTHAANGRLPLRISHGQIRYQPAWVEEVLTEVARRLRAEQFRRQAQ